MRKVDPLFWNGKRIFLTGHTGFKGSWLSIWLSSMGAVVRGYALEPPTTPSLFQIARVDELLDNRIGDVRDLASLKSAICEFEPEIVIHMAAQPLVRLSYSEPVETYSTNVIGTVNLFEVVRVCASVKAVVNVTTDKCYENREWVWGYRETEPMGGHDPYSSSKGCSELVTNSYRSSYFTGKDSVNVASARAGNVIGGGDWAEDRLIPDILRAFQTRESAVVRSPGATRPWQHVLEPLSGYLILAEELCSDEGAKFAEGWNFGPNDSDVKPVQWILDRMVTAWGEGASWELDLDPQPHEAKSLKLDISKARAVLAWSPSWDLQTALTSIVEWHKNWQSGEDMRAVTLRQIKQFNQVI